MFARATLLPYPVSRDARELGQWFCAPPFRMVCPYRVPILPLVGARSLPSEVSLKHLKTIAGLTSDAWPT